MAIFKYKYGKHGSFYVPGEEIPANKMKCRDCNCLIQGYFKDNPELYVCTGAKEPFVIYDYETAECTQYKDRLLPTTTSKPPMPPVKPLKKPKIQRIYEDDDFIIDLFPEEPMVRVSIFKDNHFQDEVFVRKAEYCMEGGAI